MRDLIHQFQKEDIEGLVELTRSPIWRLDWKTKIIHANTLFFDVIEFSPIEAKHLPWNLFLDRFDSESITGMNSALALLVEVGIPFDVRVKLKTGNKDYKTIDLNAVAVRDQNGEVISILGMIAGGMSTQQNQAEMHRIITEHQQIIIRSSRMSALGEMAAGIAHEINNPLAIILGKIAKIKRSLKETTEISRDEIAIDLEKIDSTTERIVKIIKGLRSFSRSSDQDPFTRCSLSQIVEDTLSFCREKIQKNGTQLHYAEPEPDAKLLCRPAQLSQVLLNLLNNAQDAIQSTDGEKWIRINSEVVRDKLILKVTDSGLGIPSEIAEKLMQPFFTTKPPGKGTGLGLSISKGIIEDHQGKFYLNPASPNTQFVIELPLAQ